MSRSASACQEAPAGASSPVVGSRPTRVLLAHNKLTSFVRLDRDLLANRYGVEELAVAGRRVSPWRTWWAVRRCDVVFCWFAGAHSLLPALMGRLLGRPVVVVVGGYDTANVPESDYGHQRGGLKKYVARAIMCLATRLIANSRYTRDEAIGVAGADALKITVVPHGVPVSGRGVPRVGVERERDLVLTAGNVDRPNLTRKGLEPFVRAATLLPHHRFILVGAWLDDAIDHLRAIAPPNVIFTGWVADEELAALLPRAAVYVQASTHEGFGVALAEAMAAGCVPVVTRAGALPEVVGDAGIYAASPRPADLAAAIVVGLAAGPELGWAARARVEARFTLERRAAGLAAVVDALSPHPPLTRGDVRGGARGHALASSVECPGPAGPAGPASAAGPDSPTGDGQGVGEDWPPISVVLPVRNEEHTIADCLMAVLAQDYAPGQVEVLVVDGRSTDRTRAVVAHVAAAHPQARMRLLDNPCGIAPAALNIGIRAAHGAIIARIDGHTMIATDYLRRCVYALKATGADNVGGLMHPVGRGYVGRCIALATGSRCGIGNSRFHYDAVGGQVDTVYLGCFRRTIFARVGLFDETLVRNQDDEFNDRITAAGGRIWLDPRIRSTYYNRGTFPSLWRQYYQYGRWKPPVLRRHPHARRLRHVAPATLVGALAATGMAATIVTVAGASARSSRRTRTILGLSLLATWGVYGAASATAAAVVAGRSGWRYLPGVLISFWSLHTSYGAGFLIGQCVQRYGRQDRAV